LGRWGARQGQGGAAAPGGHAALGATGAKGGGVGDHWMGYPWDKWHSLWKQFSTHRDTCTYNETGNGGEGGKCLGGCPKHGQEPISRIWG
jgi:hypothetical protein